MNYISILFIENNITESLSYEKTIKEHAVQKVGKSVRQLTNKKSRFFLDFVMFVVFADFF